MRFSWRRTVGFRWCWAGTDRRNRWLFRRLSGPRSARKVPAPARSLRCVARGLGCDRWQSVHRFAILNVREIKSDSFEWINKKKLARGKFAWQEGYGAFSYGHSQVDTIVNYIINQEKHHAKRSFRDEYLTLLKK